MIVEQRQDALDSKAIRGDWFSQAYVTSDAEAVETWISTLLKCYEKQEKWLNVFLRSEYNAPWN